MTVEIDTVDTAMTTAVTTPRIVELVEAHVNVEHGRVLEHEAAMTTFGIGDVRLPTTGDVVRFLVRSSTVSGGDDFRLKLS